MVKTLTKHGNSAALVIDRAILDLLNIDMDTPLEISTDGQSLTIKPIRDEQRLKQFEESLQKANRKYGRALKNLAE